MNLTRVSTCLGILACFAVSAAGTAPKATLKIGDPAPPVEVIRWVKGEPVNLNRGRVNVVEFWATWCGPCKASMPHLSSLALKYKDQVDITGISVFETDADPLPLVERFVAHAGDSMTYNVGFGGGNDCAMGRTWFQAAGLSGIPQAFIVDRQGKIAWFGGPMEGLEEALELAVQDKLDAAAAARVDREFKAKLTNAKILTRQINREARAGNLEKFAQLVHTKATVEGFDADEIVSSAYSTLANAHANLAAVYSEQILKEFGNAPAVLIAVANDICGESGRIRKDRDVTFALKLLAKAEACQEADMDFHVLYARALFMGKDFDNAIKRQGQAIRELEAFKALVEGMVKSADEKEHSKGIMLRKGTAMMAAKFDKELEKYKAASRK